MIKRALSASHSKPFYVDNKIHRTKKTSIETSIDVFAYTYINIVNLYFAIDTN